MASSRRGAPPDLRGTLGSLFRTTMEQVGIVRDAVERGAKNQWQWFDDAAMQRRYQDAMASLGEAVYELAVRGELGDLQDFPEIATELKHIERLEEEITHAEQRARRHARLEKRATSGQRGRGRAASAEHGVVESRDWRPPTKPADVPVWRPGSVAQQVSESTRPPTASPEPTAAQAEAEPRTRRSARSRRGAARQGSGGIRFVADNPANSLDDDLEEYMCDDDLPPSDNSR